MKEGSKLKNGYFSSSNSRDFREQYFSYNLSGGFDPNNPNSYLNDPAYLQYIASPVGGIRTNYSFARYISDTFSHPYTASLDVNAVYLLGDIGIFPWLRVITGARVEQTLLDVN